MPKASPALRHTILLAIFTAAVALPFLRVPTHAAVVASPAAIRIAPWFAIAIAAVWITASALRTVSLAMAWMHLRRVCNTATPIALDDTDGFTAGGRHAALCASADVSSPAILGFFRPALLLPDWLVPTLSPQELRQIALHECEHLRRRDDWVNLLLQIGLVIMPLNPALLWLNHRIAEQRELACDAAVIASTAQPLAYAASLTRIAEQRLQHNSLRLALAALGRKSELAQRVHALLRQPTTGWSRRQSAMACTAATVALLTASVGLSRVPRLIRVAPADVSRVATPLTAETTPQPIHASGSPTAPRMLPVSFEIKPAAKPHKKPLHVKQNHTENAVAIVPAIAITPHFVRTSAEEEFPVVKPHKRRLDNTQPRYVTTEFIQPYVAVPVNGGWLLIQL
jgi:beta-lactamase regulating signal transducer with metallopeptidase domain